MSEDYADSSSDSALHTDSPETNVENLRIAISARTQEDAAAFQREFEKQLTRKAKTPQQVLSDPKADIAIYLLGADDFAGGPATVETIARLSAGSASRNIMLEPVIGEIQARRRMTETLSDFARRNGYERLAVEKEAKDAAELARHRARAVAKLLIKSSDSSENPPAADNSDLAARKLEKRAERTAMRAQRKLEKAEGAPPGLVEAVSPDDKAAKRAARKAANGKSDGKSAKRRKRRDDSNSESGGAGDKDRQDRKAEKAARKAEGKGSRRKGKRSDEPERALSISITGLGDPAAGGLLRALTQKLTALGFEVTAPGKKSDVAIHGFEGLNLNPEAITQRLESIADDNARVTVFLERSGSSPAEFAEHNRAIAKLAAACRGSLLRLDNKFRRYEGDSLKKGEEFTKAGLDLIADSILGILAVELPKHAIARPVQAPPSDLAEARALAESPSELLAQLLWDEPIAPKLLWTHVSKESMEALVDEKLPLSSGEILGLRAPIAWPDEISDRATSIQILGLEFLTGPLSYWYSKASGHGSKQLAEIDAALKNRGVKASEILSRAERLMMDFAMRYPAGTASDAWQEKAVSRRVRVLTLYILSCRMALKRHIRFDTGAFAGIFRNLLDLIEVLRADDFYKPASIDGFDQDCLLAGLGLALRGTTYGNRLLDESLERLRTLQLEIGFTGDGVWRVGSFSDHCSLLSTFKTLMGDFGKADAALMAPFAAAAKKMTVFAEALLKSNGQPPSFDDSKQKSFASKLSGTRRALAQADGKKIAKSKLASMPRMADTYVFRDAQYFVSHSTQKVSDESSLVLLHADSANLMDDDPGGVTLAFAYGEADLLRRGEAPELEKRKDKRPLFDPALRNGYHVNGVGFDCDGKLVPNAARIVKSWRGPGWAAAKSIDEINPEAVVTRVVIHLKAVHALLVLDALETHKNGEASFEQFWHGAPGLAERPGAKGTLRFASPDGGMSIAFDADDDVTVEAEGEGSRICRTRRLAKGYMATLFQWTRAPEPAAISVIRQENSGWALTASGSGFDVRLVLSGDDLRCEESKRV